MKPIVPTMLALLLVGSAGLSGLVPAYAQDQTQPAPAAPAPQPPATPGPDMRAPDIQAPDLQARDAQSAPDAQGSDDQAPDMQAPQRQRRGGNASGFNRNWRQQGNSMQAPSGRRGGWDDEANGGDQRFGGGFGGNRMGRGFGGGGGFGGGMGRGLGTSLLALSCGDRGAEALEIAFVRIQYEIKPNAQQQPLLDALKTTALAGQKNYADACQAAISSLRSRNGAQSGMLDRFAARLALETARVNALNDILPKFRAFFDSLSDQQKAAFQPAGFTRGGPGANGGGFGGWRGRQGEPAGNGGQSAPATPTTPGSLQRLPPPGGGQPNPSAPPSNPAADASETPA